ncbi:GGDEF domain-containing protein [Aliidiomarina taiwanensis]|uniref:diguanylate cyclase n=1 Tax=Aliidiomarina taiwanensis TaxID=946228 RepID=A0A432X1P0_9GAMM|nr:diguanylate cyclase [Aliidiomarina taiwanensis]RUO40455.1 GGDEF domain-containing protein [Aliidiomarina taiwanensis]
MDRRKHDRAQQAKKTVTTKLLLQISGWACVVLLCASTIHFFLTYERAKTSIIQTLQFDIDSRLERSQLFLSYIEKNAENLEKEFLRRYDIFLDHPDWAERFDAWYEETSPGVLRLKSDFYHGVSFYEGYFRGVTSFIGPHQQPLTQEFKLRILAAQHTLNKLGPAWEGLVAGTHFSLPENALIQYSLEHPWGLLADKNLVITDFSVVKSTLQSENPERRPGWTGLYHDTTAGYWTLTYQKPVDRDGQHLVNASFDVRLDWLINNLTARPKPNAEHFVLNSKGEVVGASNIRFQSLSVPVIGEATSYKDAQATAMFHALEAANKLKENAVVYGFLSEQILIVQHIENAGWWYITAYPLGEIRSKALIAPLQFTIGGVILVLFILVVVYWLIRRDVSKPLRYLSKVANMVDAKNYNEVVRESKEKVHARGEVELVLQAFRTVAARFIRAQEQLEHEVKERTAELEEANKELDRLAHLDGLTSLLNRRSFDRDLRNHLREEGHYWLVLGDIDDFKLFNDNYGHEAGDVALQTIAGYLNSKFHGHAYRYGGEELALLLPVSDTQAQREAILSMIHDIECLEIPHEFSSRPHPFLGVSFGVAPLLPGDSPEDVIRRADERLYEAKNAGGKQVKFCPFIAH